MRGPDISPRKMRTAKLLCIRGHERTPDNLNQNRSCKKCIIFLLRTRHNKAPKYVEMRRLYRLAHPEATARNRHRRNGYPEPTRARPLTCECCGKPGKRLLALDHDHPTNAFRGWLCTRCNTGIGALGDNLAGVLRAVAYLKGEIV